MILPAKNTCKLRTIGTRSKYVEKIITEDVNVVGNIRDARKSEMVYSFTNTNNR